MGLGQKQQREWIDSPKSYFTPLWRHSERSPGGLLGLQNGFYCVPILLSTLWICVCPQPDWFHHSKLGFSREISMALKFSPPLRPSFLHLYLPTLASFISPYLASTLKKPSQQPSCLKSNTCLSPTVNAQDHLETSRGFPQDVATSLGYV